jgi:F-type H+-transporting ATPase subunit a
MKTFSLFLPANTTFFLALLLVPIEFISYIAKPISLGVRLFINLMAGHSLLKVIVGFAWSMLLLENFTSFGLMLIPMIILVIIIWSRIRCSFNSNLCICNFNLYLYTRW